MKSHSKRYSESEKTLDRNKTYNFPEAISILKKVPKVKFDETVEINIHLNVDPKNSDQLVRGTVVLPHGTGKKVKVAVFCKGEHEKQAKEAGADYVGAEDLIDKVAKGFLDFDRAIATPEMMKDLSKLGKVLGPKGLMPSPKAGTVTNNIASAIKEVKAGKIEFKTDKQAGIHVGIGKISFAENQLVENATTLMETIKSLRPASVKGIFLRSVSIATTMGPGLKINA
ncbi:MAG: 50S ribosomal protein L1 [Candidatus Omnitrophica bacterium]|nr:50S ribosomal protein L1 [Candidatus Omnitrophota bacterium]HOX54185.1 50S ribosomal protein L1 [Candidatus Omnitrophota bacterium]